MLLTRYRITLCFSFLITVIAVPVPSVANERLINMIRIELPFPETMELLKMAIQKQNYTVTRVQKVDYGLEKRSFKTDPYQVVFFGKKSEIRTLSKEFPTLIPFLPLKIVVFAEGLDTIILSDNYFMQSKMYNNSELSNKFSRWRSDVKKIFRRVQQTAVSE